MLARVGMVMIWWGGNLGVYLFPKAPISRLVCKIPVSGEAWGVRGHAQTEAPTCELPRTGHTIPLGCLGCA